MTHAALLLFALCSAPDPAWPNAMSACEEGEVRARTCEIAIRYVTAGIRPGQELHIWSCEVRG
ncbi:hypothetical protein UFOVP747_62 [uncultured Caudovirales phage]|uniref:Uncharacterized protein n=1 Tax=uncultured Caudovirales phage TaxID=2100421 RepID=A0A6J7X480_9CAUD|nr:hypothetical protein UFOVP675_37 [uncultured Caudovirales phage]CAB5225663.1 hypothetical protein UFOVP747_62 [uncultured Caudovirales phage]